MPLYVFRCEICALEIEDIQPTGCSEIKCSFCGSRGVRAYDKQNVRMIGDIEPRFDESLGVHIGSRREYREQLAYNNAYSPDLFIGGNPSDGRLTREEREEVEGRRVVESGTIFDRRRSPGWASNPSVDDTEGIGVEGEADYEPIKQHIKEQHERRRANGK